MTTSPPLIAQILYVLLWIIIVCLSIGLVFMIGTAAFVQFSSEAREAFMAKLEATGGEVPSLNSLALSPLIAAIMAGSYLYVAFVVKQIVKTTLKGDPFVEANISRLRKTWIVIALVEIFRMFVLDLLPGAPDHAAGSALTSYSMDTRLSAWFLVFVIAVMAEVFRIGLELRRDQELTV